MNFNWCILSHIVWSSCLSQLQDVLECGSSNLNHLCTLLFGERIHTVFMMYFYCIAAWRDSIVLCRTLIAVIVCQESLGTRWLHCLVVLACSPWLNNRHTWSLILLSRLSSRYMGELCRALLWWSHISHEMFHSSKVCLISLSTVPNMLLDVPTITCPANHQEQSPIPTPVVVRPPSKLLVVVHYLSMLVSLLYAIGSIVDLIVCASSIL